MPWALSGWLAGALILLLVGARLFIRGIANRRRTKQLLDDILRNPDGDAATRDLHDLMKREMFREPYDNASPEYIAWVQQNSAVKDQGRVIVGVILIAVGIWCLVRSLAML